MAQMQAAMDADAALMQEALGRDLVVKRSTRTVKVYPQGPLGQIMAGIDAAKAKAAQEDASGAAGPGAHHGTVHAHMPRCRRQEPLPPAGLATAESAMQVPCEGDGQSIGVQSGSKPDALDIVFHF